MNEAELQVGHLRCRTIIEVLGKPKEHVEGTIKKYVEKIKEDPNFIIVKEEYSETKEQESMFSIFVELEMVSKGFDKLVGFCFDYMPSSVEIIKPETFHVENNKLTALLSDLQARLHNVDMIVKQLRNEGDFLKLNLNKALKNQIILMLKMGPRSVDELSRITGIHIDEVPKFLEQLEKDGQVSKKEGVYTINDETKKEG